MLSTQILYPANPSALPAGLLQPSASFKKQVAKVLSSIFLFFAVYLFMIALSILLVGACVYGGIALIIALPKFFTLMIGLGMVGLGIMVFVFLIKFIFAVSKVDQSGSIEVTKTGQPELYAFIQQLTKDTQTRLPKKIFLSPEVNACVFYNSSFWSMFFPVRKNLQIGMGLVNTLNLTEFKAVLAHEFGHFSQRSMKLGSYVYNLNRVIYNMLYENNSYGNFIQGWASASNYFAMFASITVSIVQGIQWVLRNQYSFINKNYYGLSREMEFHADTVAASVSGSHNMINALRKVELGDVCYSSALQRCEALLKQRQKTDNVYSNQLVYLRLMAKEHQLAFTDNQVTVNVEFFAQNNLSRINYKNQWASHPTLHEREAHLESLNIDSVTDMRSAWVLFTEPAELQKQLTEKLYANAGIENEGFVILPAKDLEQTISIAREKSTHPDFYKGYYDGRWIEEINVEELKTGTLTVHDLSSLLNEEKANLQKRIHALAEDVQVLQAIEEKKLDIKTFDFDGNKYKRDSAAAIKEQLTKESLELKEELKKNDLELVQYFYTEAVKTNHQDEYATMLEQHFKLRKKQLAFNDGCNNMFKKMRAIYAGETIGIDTIKIIIDTLKTKDEPDFKEHLSYWKQLGAFCSNTLFEETLTKFIAAEYIYFDGKKFNETGLNNLYKVYQSAFEEINEFVFQQFRSITFFQLNLIERERIFEHAVAV